MPSKRKASTTGTTRRARSAVDSKPSQTITLVLRPSAALQKKFDTLGQGPIEPLSYEQYGKLYGTPDKELQQLETWASGAQMQFADTDWREKAKLSGVVRLKGEPKKLASHFRVNREVGTGAQKLEAPKPLASLVVWAFGLEPQAVLQLTASSDEPTPEPLRYRATVRRFLRQKATRKARAALSGPRDLSPLEVAAAYHYPANQGAGQCLGLIQLTGDYDPNDIQQYLQGLGVTTQPRIEHVSLGKPVSGMGNLEVTLDLELAASLCPEATLVVYNACSKNFALGDFFDVFAAAVFDTKNRPSVLSCSWAFPECVEGVNASLNPPYTIRAEEEAAFNLLFMKAALLGITICAASGDTGSLISFPSNGSATMATPLPITYFPASSPYVLGCGGTQPVSPQAPFAEEAVWNELDEVLIIGSGPYANPAAAGSSGGGVSFLNPLPPYQEDCSVPEVVVANLNNGIYAVQKRQQGRGVPDVAAFSHMGPGYSILFQGEAATGGGTSAAAPMWAALITRVNAALGKRVGFLHPGLYRYQFERKTLCKTIQRGGNGAYQASQALWNPCTGLGTPNGKEIVKAFKSS